VLIVSPSTARALAPHTAEKSWVMFIQVNLPVGGQGPIKIEGVKGAQIAPRLRAIASDNAFDAMLIGLIETTTPDEYAKAISAQYAGAHMHDEWYEPTADLIAFIQHAAQGAITSLLAQAHPGTLSTTPVDINEMARQLDVSVPTVRRMVKAGEIPCLRWGQWLRFVPADVVASLQRRGR
jgi:excisionase family DNA binding protein